MKKLTIFATVLFLLVTAFYFSNSAEAATRTNGYYKPSTGRYVQPYYRSSQNSTRWDNYSTKGNYNPFTGKKGYTSPYKSYRFR